MKNRPIFWIAGLFLLMLLLGVGVVLLSPLLDRPGPPPRVLTPEEIAALDDQYAFRILASPFYESDKPIIEQAENLPLDQNRLLDADGKPLAVWIDVDPKESSQFAGQGGIVARTFPLDSGQKQNRVQLLLLVGEYDVYGEDCVRGTVFSKTTHSGFPAIAFQLAPEAAHKFARLTGENVPDPTDPAKRRCLAIVLDGKLISAPTIMSRISDQGVITFAAPTTTAEKAALKKRIDDFLKRSNELKKSLR